MLLQLPDSTRIEVAKDAGDEIDGVTASYLKIDTGSGLVIRLAIDQQTHRPAMAAYEIKGTEQYSAKESSSAASENTQVQIYFSEYKPVAGKGAGDIWLPHQITKTRNGLVVEDMHIKKYRANPRLKQKQFEQKHS